MSAGAAHIPGNRIVAIAAEGAMGSAERIHLEGCGPCRDALATLTGDLTRLRRQAEAFAPAPRRRFVLPADPAMPRHAHRGKWGWAAFGTAFAAALVTVFIWRGEVREPGRPPAFPAVVEWKDPEMIEVERLAENALPEAYMAMSESLEDGYDEGFIDFLIPPLEDDAVS